MIWSWLKRPVPLWILLVVVLAAGVAFLVGRWFGGAGAAAAMLYLAQGWARARTRRARDEQRARTEYVAAVAEEDRRWEEVSAENKQEAREDTDEAATSASAAATDAAGLLDDL